MTSDILLKFAKKGINLSPNAYKMIINSEDPKNLTSSFIIKLKSKEFTKDDLVSVSEDILNEFINGENNTKDNLSIKSEDISNNLNTETINKETLEKTDDLNRINKEKTSTDKETNNEKNNLEEPINQVKNKSRINKLEYNNEIKKEFDAS